MRRPVLHLQHSSDPLGAALSTRPLAVHCLLLCCRRIAAVMDAKIMNAFSYKIAREDHTLGNLLRM